MDSNPASVFFKNSLLHFNRSPKKVLIAFKKALPYDLINHLNMKKISSLLARVVLFSFILLAVAPVLVPAVSSSAMAQTYGGSTNYASASQLNTNVLVDVMCNVLRIITGNAGKAFAAFAILSVGIGFFTGKVSWGLMIGVAAGIAAMFGAPTIVAAITGTNTFSCSGSTS